MLPNRYTYLCLATLLLAGCGEQPTETSAPAESPSTPPAEAPETTSGEATPPETAAPDSSTLAAPPVARQPRIPPPSSHIALNPGTYRADAVELTLSALRFELAAADRDVAAEGTYEIINSILTLTATTGETGDVGFPLSCLLSRAGPQILFEDFDDGSCGFLQGMLFQRETRPG